MTYRVLIVDDQREVSRLLKSALETIEQGLLVVEAPSGEEALLEVSRNRVDLLIADFRLPGITGVELMNKVRARHPDAKVILITGVTDPRVRSEVAKAGGDAYFTKPVPMADFLDAVERLLGMERTILPSESSAEKSEERKSLGDLLVDVRKQLGAVAVVLVSDRGRVVAQAGDLPDPNMEVSLLSSLMAVYSAAQKVSLLVEHSATANLHLFRGEQVDVIFAPVGLVHAVLVLGRGIASGDRLLQSIRSLSTVQPELEERLKGMGVTGQLSPRVVEEYEAARQQEAVPETAEEASADLEALLNMAGKPVGDADAFWESAVEKGPAFTLKDTLSFEEASKLGLAPGSSE